MKIVLVAQEYFPESARGGIGTQTFMKAQGLAALGHQVYIIARSTDQQRHERISENICEICIPGMTDRIPEMTNVVQWLTHSVLVAVEIETLDKQVGIDIIDFPEWAAEGYTYLLNRTSWKTIPAVIQLHGPLVMFTHTLSWPEIDSEFYRIGTHMEATCVRLADAVYSSSKCSADWVNRYYNVQKQNIPIIHSGINVKEFTPQPAQKNDRPTIIFIGKIVQNKGVEELVEAACNLVKDYPDLRLRILGRGENGLIARLQQKAAESGAGDLLEFPGFINKEALPDELFKAHIFAAPSYYEGGPGFVYLEAMACGLPVIACSGSGIDEIITNGENGILVPPKNSHALAEALKKILSDKILMENMGKNARNFAVKEADSADCIKKLEAFYFSVLSKPGTNN